MMAIDMKIIDNIGDLKKYFFLNIQYILSIVFSKIKYILKFMEKKQHSIYNKIKINKNII